jgi:hypothetical protein
MVPALWVRPGQGYLDTVVGTSYCTVEAVLIEHWPLCRVNGRFFAWCGTGEPRLAGLCTAVDLLGTLVHLALASFSTLRRYTSPWGLCYC